MSELSCMPEWSWIFFCIVTCRLLVLSSLCKFHVLCFKVYKKISIFFRTSSKIAVYVGRHKLTKPGPNQVRLDVDNIILHPDYNNKYDNSFTKVLKNCFVYLNRREFFSRTNLRCENFISAVQYLNGWNFYDVILCSSGSQSVSTL